MTFPFLAPTTADVQRRSAALGSWLTQLLWLYSLFSVLGIVGLVGSAATLLAASALPGAGAPGIPLLIALVLASGLLGLVSLVLYVLAIRAAKRVLGSVAGAAEDRLPATLDQDVRRLNTWLTWGQWGMVVGAVLGVALNGVTSAAFSEMSSEVGLPVGVTVVAVAIGSLPSIVLNWLILASVKRFFARVSVRARGARQPVGPAAGAAAGWLMFVYVFLWIAAGLSVLGFLPALLLPAVLGSRGGSEAALGGGVVFLIGALALAVGGWFYSLLLRLVGHSRLFALEVAALLDQPRPGEAAPVPDPWLGVPDLR
ncbi:hypothetical protein [Deinococcus sp. Leaf326]|uniref:hypothetical protein n=1 Tax=Deinococcus sp. Leaf326 TaxID=1736338 RepID=UPI0006FB0B1C|nr:hypothetical protein [Deinococcus sp. Leaf326]KQR04544.1 hypothetical protein ASF71_10930 [Deinococcus sp. Leaf326]